MQALRHTLIFTATFLSLTFFIKCKSPIATDKNIEETALKIADNIDMNSINLLKKYSFVKRGDLEFWQQVSGDSSLYSFSLKTVGDTSELTVNRPYNFIKDFHTNYHFDTSNYYEFKFSKLDDTIRKVVKLANQAKEIKNDTVISIKQFFPNQDPFVTIIQLTDFRNKYNIVGTSYYNDIGDIMVFWLSPQFKLTYIPDTSKLNPKSKKFWLDEFNKGKHVKMNWSLLKVYE